MHQQNIMFVFLPVPKLVKETTVKVKNILRMQLQVSTCSDFHICHLGNLTGEFRFLNLLHFESERNESFI